MDRATFKQFKKLLQSLPVWVSVSSRATFLQEIFLGHPLLQQFDIGAAGDIAASQLVQLLDAYQEPNVDGMTPACALLKHIRDSYGAMQERAELLATLEAAFACAGSGIRSLLFLTANPADDALDPLRTDSEFREIKDALAGAGGSQAIQLHLPEFALRRDDLTKALQQTRPGLVHFSGHGGGSPGLYLQDAQGQAQLISTEALASVFRLFKDDVQAVVLNACLSKPQAKAIAQHIGYVIGTGAAIGDETAIQFSIGFYRALAVGRSIEEAFQAGCTEIQVADIPEQDIPLVMQGQGSVVRCGD